MRLALVAVAVAAAYRVVPGDAEPAATAATAAAKSAEEAAVEAEGVLASTQAAAKAAAEAAAKATFEEVKAFAAKAVVGDADGRKKKEMEAETAAAVAAAKAVVGDADGRK